MTMPQSHAPAGSRMILVLCPCCRNQVNCDQAFAGMILACPFCQGKFQMPGSPSGGGRQMLQDESSRNPLGAEATSAAALTHPCVEMQEAPSVVGESPVYARLLRRGDSKLSSALKSVLCWLGFTTQWALQFLGRLSWRRRLSSVCRRVSPKENPGFAISAVVHATILIALAFLVVPTSPGKTIQWLLLAEQELELDEELDIFKEIAVQISLQEPTDGAHLTLLGKDDSPSESINTQVEPVQFADLSLPVRGAGEFDFPASESLLRDLDELKPARRVNDTIKRVRNIAERQLAELKMPDNAIRAGSFCVFAEPADPIEEQPYWLIIQLELPPDLTRRTSIRNDVTGLLTGSDGFRMTIPSGPAFFVPVGPAIIAVPKPPGVQDRYHLGDGQARWAIWVPGASKNVQDTIHVYSKLRDEKHSLNVEF